MGAKYILAIDQSTSGTKAIIFDDKCNLVHRVTESHTQYYPKPSWVEHDPIEIYNKMLLAVKRVIAESGISKSDIVVLSITNQRETAVVWNKKDGNPVYNAVVWQCQRGVEACEELKKSGYEDFIKSKTGLIIDPYFSATKIKWIMENVPGIAKKASDGEIVFGTIDSWIIFKLTKGKVHATDYSNASRTMLFNIYQLKWDKEIFDIMGIYEQMAPEVKFSDEVFGYTTLDGILEKEIPIIGVMGDSHASLFGQNCFEKGMAKATYGTGSSIMMNIGKQPVRSPEGLVTSIGWGSKGEIYYVLEGNIHCTGDTIKWLVDNLELIPNSKVSEEYARNIDDNGGVYFVPAFVGLGAPYWDNKARACITGMSRGTKKAHIIRAALESIAYQIKDLIDLMVESTGIALGELRVDGGPTKNNFLMQFQADMLGTKVARTSIEEISAMGSALMAGLSVGIWKDFNELSSLRKVDKVFKTAMDSDTRNKYYEGWKESVRRVLTK